ncbi:MAG: radical SAM protein [Corynebacterium sp.]|nr:radical SAM protein [Corynebacterium sp.]
MNNLTKMKNIKTDNNDRSVFHEYCQNVLNTILSAATIYDAEGQRTLPDAYCLRYRDSESSNEFGIGQKKKLSTLKNKINIDPIVDTTNSLLKLTIPEDATSPVTSASWKHSWDSSSHTWDESLNNSRDFVFSFPIPARVYAESEAHYLSKLLCIILDEVDLFDGNSIIVPRFLKFKQRYIEIPYLGLESNFDLANREEDLSSKLRRQPLFSVSQTEPTIPILARHWALFSGSTIVSTKDKDINIVGFRLRCTEQWVVPSHGHPSEIYEHLARICNVACSFCYLFGNPNTLAIARAKKSITKDELETRLFYYNPENKRALFSAQWELNEFLVDPRLPDVLKQIRLRTDRPFFFTTNGNPLTPNIVKELSKLKPVHFVVSTNTVNEPLRQEVMKEKPRRTWTALNCLEELSNYEIPFGVSMVATPDFSLDDLTKTIKSVEHLKPAFIRVNQAGFTRDHPESIEFDTEELWSRVVGWAKNIRKEIKTPLITIPSAFEENFFYDDPLAPRIIGTIPGSPGAAAGLQPGDLILQVGFLSPKTRSELISALLLIRGKVSLKVKRNSNIKNVILDTDGEVKYPYSGNIIGKYLVPLGVFIAPSLSIADANLIKTSMNSVSAKSAWLVTSSIMFPAAKMFLQKFLPELCDKIDLVVAKNDYLGGNIRVLDMCTVSDISNSLKAHADRAKNFPDVVLLPATGFNIHGRDLSGRHWGDLERQWKIPVKLINSTTQFVF